MKLRPEELSHHLSRILAPLYLIAGAEPLLVQECADSVRAAAREAGWSERERLVVDTNFDWGAVSRAAASFSLFAERRLLELRMETAKPGVEGARALTEYASQPAADVLLLIVAGRLDTSAQRSAWLQALEGVGVVVLVPALQPRELPSWLYRRLRARGFEPSREAVVLLAERVEGNLLAAAQEVEKLTLVRQPGSLTADDLLAAVSDNARFDVYVLADAAVAGDCPRVVRVLSALRDEGIDGTLVNWALARELRGLASMACDHAQGLALEAVFSRHRVWRQRQPLLRRALPRYDGAGWAGLLRQAARIDRILKGIEAGSVWDELLQLALAIAGRNTLTNSR